MQELLDPFRGIEMPAPSWIPSAMQGMRSEYADVVRPIKEGIETSVATIRTGLEAVPPTVLIAMASAGVWRARGARAGVIAGAALASIGYLGVWAEALTTLSIVLAAAAVCVAIGIPVGVLTARSRAAQAATAPVFDAMQTIPPFVYLVPVVLIVGIGDAAGVIVTVVFAVPPLIRLTGLGLREVPTDLVRAASGLGASPLQTLVRVQMPLAWPSIAMGINQMMMMALSMAVIASMIAVAGLGQLVLRGIGSLDMTTAAVGGAAIVLLAIVIEQMTESRGTNQWTGVGRV